MNNHAVTIITVAYNAGNTIRRCADSVLGQTYKNTSWFVVDNGSTDKTSEILQEYEQSHDNIKLVKNNTNYIKSPDGEHSVDHFIDIFDYCKDEYFAVLDADDEYSLDFLEKAVAFLEENDCDVVLVGTEFRHEITDEILAYKKIDNNIVLQTVDHFDKLLPYYYQFARTTWGKLIKTDLLSKCDFSVSRNMFNGSDTAFALEVLKHATRVGIIAEPLHKYYEIPKSVSKTLQPKRLSSNRILYEEALKFLQKKVGFVSPQNEDFLLAVYINALVDTQSVLLKSELSAADKLSGLYDMFMNEYTHKVVLAEHLGYSFSEEEFHVLRRELLFKETVVWLLSLEDVPDDEVERYCNLGEFVSAVAEDGDAWIFFKKLRVQFLLEHGREEEAAGYIAELDELV
jgi:glycosyltransferase involved in cell wall biosynthesis